jgi:hypothetical protein
LGLDENEDKDEEKGDSDVITLTLKEQRRFKTTIGVLRKGNIPYFAGLVEEFAGDLGPHEKDLPQIDGKYFVDIIAYMQNGTLPLETTSLDRLLWLRKMFDYLATRLPSARRGYMIGGHEAYGGPGFEMLWPPSYDGVRSDLLAYDPQEDSWVTMSPMKTKRQQFATCCAGTDIYVMGGRHKRAEPYSNLVEKYDSLTDTWVDMPPMNHARINHFAAVVGKKIYVMGGGDLQNRGRSDTIEVFDLVDKTWTVLVETLPGRISGATTCVVGTDIYLFGEKNWYGGDPGTVRKFDTVRHVWTWVGVNVRLGATNMKLHMLGSATLVGDVVYLTPSNGPLVHGETFIFDPKSGRTSPVASSGKRVGGHTFALGGNIYDVDWNHLERAKNHRLAKGTIDADDGSITWSMLKNIPGNGREYFGVASVENRDVLHDAIIRLR